MLDERRWHVAHQGGAHGAAARGRVGADDAARLLGRPCCAASCRVAPIRKCDNFRCPVNRSSPRWTSASCQHEVAL